MYRKVLIVDDDPFTVMLFKKVNAIAEFSQEVVACLSAVDGLDYLSGLEEKGEAAPEAIFLDICMPIVNGWQFLEHVKTLPATLLTQTKLYMLAASTDQSDINRAKKFAIVEDYIVKPITVSRLQAIQARTISPSGGVINLPAGRQGRAATASTAIQ